MQLYEITLPLLDNSGKPTRPAHRAYQAWLIDTFVGYSASVFNGAWRDQSDGKTYYERNTSYRVASDLADAPALLVRRAQELFPDQLAFFWAHLGVAAIHVVSQ